MRPLLLVLALLLAPAVSWAAGPNAPSPKPQMRPGLPKGTGPGNVPPPSPLRYGPNGEPLAPPLSGGGPYHTPTPTPVARQVSAVADFTVSIQDTGQNFVLKFVSSMPLRKVSVLDPANISPFFSIDLADGAEFTVEVPYSLSPGIKVQAQVNTGFFKGKQVVKNAEFEVKNLTVEPEEPQKAGAKSP